MNRNIKWASRCVAMATLALIPALTMAAVKVTFVEPEHFRDATRVHAAQKDEVVLKGLRKHFEALGKRFLASGQDLDVEVLDVDLAGRHELLRTSTEQIRILRGATDWPEIRFRYTFKQDGKVVRQEEVRVIDQSYLTKPNIHADSDMLAYERRMLEDWFRQTFATRKAAETP